MFKINRFFKSETGIKLLSIMLGLAIAGLFKMSCDSRSCIVYKGPSFNNDNKVIKYNNECYNVEEQILDCKDKSGQLIDV